MKLLVLTSSLLFIVASSLAVMLYRTASNLVFLDEAREKEKMVYPFYIERVKVEWKGLRLSFPAAFEGFEDKKTTYLNALDSIRWQAEPDCQIDWHHDVVIKFVNQEEPKVKGVTWFTIELPVKKIESVGLAMLDIKILARRAKECEKMIEQLEGNIGHEIASRGWGLSINEMDIQTAAANLDYLSSFLGSSFYAKDKARRERAMGVLWIYATSWEMPQEYGVSSLTLRLPPTAGETKPVTGDMIVAPPKKVVVNLASPEGEEEFYRRIEEQLVNYKKVKRE